MKNSQCKLDVYNPTTLKTRQVIVKIMHRPTCWYFLSSYLDKPEHFAQLKGELDVLH